MSPLPLMWLAPLADPSGYADEARALLLALARSGAEPVARQLSWTAVTTTLPPAHAAAISASLGRAEPDGPHVLVVHTPPHRGLGRQSGRVSVVRTMFETDRVPADWVQWLVDCDEVWVPTEFNRETFVRSGLRPERVRVLPETIDFELFDPEATRPLPLDGARGFTFLSNFDFSPRKAWDRLLDAWARAFDSDDDVCLVLKCLDLFGTGEDAIRARIAAHLGGRETAPILIDLRVLDVADMPRLYAAADAYVLASRGEGWGRPYMEAMAMGLPTIGSRWSGNLAFMDDSTAFLVDGELVLIDDADEVPTEHYRGHRWFSPDVDALAAAMRTVRAGGADVKGRARAARRALLARYAPEPFAAAVSSCVEEALRAAHERAARPVACAWRGDWGSIHSLAVVNDGLAGALADGGVRVEQLARASALDEELVGVASHWPPSFEPPATGPFVLYQPWEFGAIPHRWVEEIRLQVDEVWTPSAYSRAAFVDSGVPGELVKVVPNGVDLDRFSPEGPVRELPGDPTFLFVGGTIYRKGIDVLLRAWDEAFPEGGARLVIKAFGSDSFYRGQSVDELIRGRRGVVLLQDDLEPDEVAALYRGADVLVQPYRGEGFCLPALEALACGVPVIVTAGGPTDDFVDDSCAWRVASGRAPLPPGALGDLAPAGDGYLLEPEIASLVEALRSAADAQVRAAKAAAAHAAAERFSWEHAGRVAAARIEALAGRTPVRRVAAALVPDRRGLLLTAHDWAPAVRAYAEAFQPGADTTLLLPVTDPDLVLAELSSAGLDASSLADVALADTADLDPAALELAADAVIGSVRAGRARRVVPPDPEALRALLRAA
jgi:glycosyltransferase involved in cell wall biosynthesis